MNRPSLLALLLSLMVAAALAPAAANADSFQKVKWKYTPDSEKYYERLLTDIYYKPSAKGTVSFQTYLQNDVTKRTIAYPIVKKRFSNNRLANRYYFIQEMGLQPGYYKAWVVAYRAGRKFVSKKYFVNLSG